MDSGFGFGGSSGGGVATPPQVAHPTNGATVVVTIGQSSGSLLLDPATNIAGCSVTLPNPPRDGQIITIGATKNITAITLTPLVPTFPAGLAKDDQFQIKWYDATNYWVLLK